MSVEVEVEDDALVKGHHRYSVLGGKEDDREDFEIYPDNQSHFITSSLQMYLIIAALFRGFQMALWNASVRLSNICLVFIVTNHVDSI